MNSLKFPDEYFKQFKEQEGVDVIIMVDGCQYYNELAISDLIDGFQSNAIESAKLYKEHKESSDKLARMALTILGAIGGMRQ